MLGLIERQQQDGTIDQSLIQRVIDAFLLLCLKSGEEKKSHKGHLHNLKALFLEARDHEEEGGMLHTEDSIPHFKFLNKVEQWLQGEGKS